MVLDVCLLFLAIFALGMSRFVLGALTEMTEEPARQEGVVRGPAGSRAA